MKPQWKWSTLPAGFAFGLLVAGLLGLLLVPQLVAVLVTAPGRLSGSGRITFFDVPKLWLRSDPTLVTGATIPPILHHIIAYGMLLVVLGIAVTFVIVLFARSQNPQYIKGLATAFDAEKELGTTQLVRDRGPKLRPTLHPQSLTPEDCGLRIGSFFGKDLWLRMEDPTIIIGPARSGKGFFFILNWILAAPGAVVTTSSKMDNAMMTMLARKRKGSKVWIFAPGVPGGDSVGHVLKWNPVVGCESELTLVRRIHALIPRDAFSGSTSNGGHWDTLGQQLSAALFHAAACMGANVDKIWEWVGSPQRAFEAVQAIREHEHGLYEYATHLETVINMPPEQRASQWGVLPTSLAFLASRSARDWMKPAPGDEIDLVDFVVNKGTLYLVGDKQSTGGYVRIIDGLLAEVDYVTKGLADVMPGTRLEPPITYLLDEAGNFEYQGLPELITAGGGRGRVGVAVFQSKNQLRQYGQDAEKTLWDAAPVKLVLPGGGDPAELQALSDLVGAQWVAREQHSWGVGPSSVSVSEEKRAIIEANVIREMKAGFAILFYKNLKPLIPKLTPFSEHQDYDQFVQDAAQLAAELREHSPFASQAIAHGGKV